MEKLPWIAEVRVRENSDYPYMAYAVHPETGARVHDDNYSDLPDAERFARQKAAQMSLMTPEETTGIGGAAPGEPIAAFLLFDSSEGVGFDYEEIPVQSTDEITPEALEAAGWVRDEAQSDRYELPPSEMYGPELTIWRVGEGPHEITVYCNDASKNDTIGYALTMSEINAITTVAKRTMRKE